MTWFAALRQLDYPDFHQVFLFLRLTVHLAVRIAHIGISHSRRSQAQKGSLL
jgi:hypothetical protein